MPGKHAASWRLIQSRQSHVGDLRDSGLSQPMRVDWPDSSGIDTGAGTPGPEVIAEAHPFS